MTERICCNETNCFSLAGAGDGCGRADRGDADRGSDCERNAKTRPHDAQGRETAAQEFPDAVSIVLSDDGIIVDGKAVSTDESAAVHTAHDIVCYESGRDFTYGEGTEADEHTAEEAEAHTVVHITQPGTYALSGTLSAGQTWGRTRRTTRRQW